MEFDITMVDYHFIQQAFTTMCQTAASLFMCQSIELYITIHGIRKSVFEKTYNPIFEQCFNQDVYGKENNKVTIVNKYCKVLPKPLISFSFRQDSNRRSFSKYDNGDPTGEIIFQVSNVAQNCEYIKTLLNCLTFRKFSYAVYIDFAISF